MRDVAGVVCALLGAWFVWSGLQRRRQAQALAASGHVPPPRHPSLELLGEMGPSVVNTMLAVAAGITSLAFLISDGGNRALSYFDLAGFLVLLGGYGYWVSMKSKHRV